jgi:hypothetical protein
MHQSIRGYGNRSNDNGNAATAGNAGHTGGKGIAMAEEEPSLCYRMEGGERGGDFFNSSVCFFPLQQDLSRCVLSPRFCVSLSFVGGMVLPP